jgi:undecaprenyl pyrophosphate phosphatase UppP
MRNLNFSVSRRLAIQASSCIAGLGLLCISNVGYAQEFSLFGGGSRAGSTNTYTWAFNYQEGLGQYFAASFTWLNEGHIPDHHRDG